MGGGARPSYSHDSLASSLCLQECQEGDVSLDGFSALPETILFVAHLRMGLLVKAVDHCRA